MLNSIIDALANGIMSLIDEIIGVFGDVFNTLEALFGIFPVDIASAMLIFTAFLLLLAIKRVAV